MFAVRWTLALGILTILFNCSCTTLGPKVMGPAQFQYNKAVANTWNEQLLLNLVRLHYRDTPVFLKVDQIVAGYTFESGASAGFDFVPNMGSGVDSADASFRSGLTERPTITLSPLQDMEFTSRLLTPISADTLLLLAGSGWQIERVLICGVREINGLRNLPATLDVNPDLPDSFSKFKALAEELERQQRADNLRIRVVVKDDQSQIDAAGFTSPKVRSMLNLTTQSGPVPLTKSGSPRKPNELNLVGRSLMDVFTFLARYVEAPLEHRKAGLVEPCAEETRKYAGPWMRIRSSKSQPSSAFVSVKYRGYWFFIPDNDLDAKETFGLLTQLFSLQASQAGGRSPLLTIPTG